MTNADSSPPKVLREEILGDAARQAERIRRRAERDAEALLETARAEARRDAQATSSAAQARAQQVQALALAKAPIETDRLRARRLEQTMETLRREAEQRLEARQGFDCRAALVRLAVDALRHMEGDTFVIELATADREAHGEQVRQEIQNRMEEIGSSKMRLTLADSASGVRAGIVVHDTDGRLVWDNSFAARMARLWPELRRRLAQSLLESRSTSPGDGT